MDTAPITDIDGRLMFVHIGTDIHGVDPAQPLSNTEISASVPP